MPALIEWAHNLLFPNRMRSPALLANCPHSPPAINKVSNHIKILRRIGAIMVKEEDYETKPHVFAVSVLMVSC